MNTSIDFRHILPRGLGLLVAVSLLVTACDMGTDAPPETSTVTYEGQVTELNSSSETSSQEADGPASTQPQSSVEGAVVTAVRVDASGNTAPLEGEATTEADGSFSITVDGAAEAAYVKLEVEGEGDFSSAVLVKNDGAQAGVTVSTPPMTLTSKAQADVFVEAQSQGSGDAAIEAVTFADVIVHVDNQVAAEIETGSASVADVAADIRAQARAEGNYYQESGNDGEAEEGKDNERQATLSLQAELATSTSADARTNAFEAFTRTVIDAYVDAGVDIETQARARQTAKNTLEAMAQTSGEAAFALKRNAEILASKATALAVEAAFEAEGATEAQLEALTAARVELMADLRAAASTEAIAEAKASYEAEVEAALEEALEVSAEALADARTSISSSLESLLSLLATITLGDGAALSAEAHVDFYTNAEATLQEELESSTNADLGARTLVLLSVFSEV